MKSNLKESDIKRIINRVKSEDLQESTWEGIKGWFKGKGYRYSKYLGELESVLDYLSEKIKSDRKVRNRLDEITKKIAESDMDDEKKKDLEFTLARIQNILTHTENVIQKELYNIYRMKK